jgi:hypothetical protein
MSELTLDARLVAMGEALEFPRAGSLADDVMAALEQPEVEEHRWRRPLLAVAAVALLVIAATLAVPASRRAVARWFGFGSYRIERVVDFPDVDAGPAPIGPLVTRGDLTTDAFVKLARIGTDVREVDVNGRPGFWISGGPHLFFTYDRNGMRQEQRLAGNTLVWQQGDQIVRVEGVDLTLEEALQIAADLG